MRPPPPHLGLLALALALTACTTRGTTVYELDGRTVLYAVDNGEAGFLIFTDMTGGHIAEGAPGDRDAAFSGTLTADAGPGVTFGSDGTSLTIGGQTFDLEDGRAFLLQTVRASRIAQLPIGRDVLVHTNDDMLEAIRVLAQMHERIRWFVWPPEIV